jgi:hypothetical protein
LVSILSAGVIACPQGITKSGNQFPNLNFEITFECFFLVYYMKSIPQETATTVEKSWKVQEVILADLNVSQVLMLQIKSW